MPNLFGPGAHGALRPSATRPAATPANGVSDPDDWFQNCTTPIDADGTVVDARMLNHWLALFRRLVRGNRQTETNLDDALLFRAARSQAGNFVPAAGVAGTANAIVLTFADPFASLADLVGTPLVFLAEAVNTTAATLAVDGLAATALTWPDGTALAAGDIANGALVEVRYDGSAFRLEFCLSPSQVRALTSLVGRTQIFTASGTFNIPSGITSTEIEVWGAGGAGGASSDGTGNPAGTAGSGGGGGGYSYKRVTGLTPGGTVSVTVGNGGVGVANAAALGGSGEASSFGPHATANGGVGGPSGRNATVSGGAGGTATGGDLNVAGARGGTGGPTATFQAEFLLHIWNKGGLPARSIGSVDAFGTGASGRGFGTGGNGASGGAAIAGGNGAPGLVIVRW
jgi:hypothetical protein